MLGLSQRALRRKAWLKDLHLAGGERRTWCAQGVWSFSNYLFKIVLLCPVAFWQAEKEHKPPPLLLKLTTNHFCPRCQRPFWNIRSIWKHLSNSEGLQESFLTFGAHLEWQICNAEKTGSPRNKFTLLKLQRKSLCLLGRSVLFEQKTILYIWNPMPRWNGIEGKIFLKRVNNPVSHSVDSF